MNTKYDDKLMQIDWFKLHKELLPFIGDNYDEYKVLQIGESHFIDRRNDDEFNICYFRDNWWNSSCNDLVKMFNDKTKYNCCWFDTRRVLQNYLDNKNGSYRIFMNIVKSFSKIMLNKEISSITPQDKQLYHHFAFMNFYQMPSLYNGSKYWNSLIKSANHIYKDDKKLSGQLAREIFRKCVETSIKTIDDVINTIKPNIIIFTSISASNAYRGKEYEDCVGKYKDSPNIIYTSHPSAPFSWNKKLKALDNKTGEQVLEDGLILLKK